MSDLQRLFKYLRPGGVEVYYAIDSMARKGEHDIDLKWLSDRLIDTWMDKHDGNFNGDTPLLCPASVRDHVADLVDVCAVIRIEVGRHVCYAMPEKPEFAITDDMLEERRQSRAILKRDIDRTDDLITRALGPCTPENIEKWGL